MRKILDESSYLTGMTVTDYLRCSWHSFTENFNLSESESVDHAPYDSIRIYLEIAMTSMKSYRLQRNIISILHAGEMAVQYHCYTIRMCDSWIRMCDRREVDHLPAVSRKFGEVISLNSFPFSFRTTTTTTTMRSPSIYSQDDPITAAMKPPLSETDSERNVRLEFEAEAKRVSEQIDEDLRAERERLKKRKGDVKVSILAFLLIYTIS